MTTVIVPIYKSFRKKLDSILLINRIAKERRFVFRYQQLFPGKAIALDIKKKKLVYINIGLCNQSCLIINMKDIDRCSIKKVYNTVKRGDLTEGNLNEFLKSIVLRLRFKDSTDDLSIPFFDDQRDKREDVPKLEAM